MIRILVIFYLFMHSIGLAQMLDNRDGEAFTERPFFDQKFIKDNKIKILNGKYSYKKTGEAMHATEYRLVYQFDKEGRLIFCFETKKDDGSKDTTWNRYTYNTHNLLIEHKRGDHKGFYTVAYEYDTKGRITKESHFKEYPDSLGKLQKTTVTFETMKYEEYERQIKKTIYNSYGLPFRYEFSYFNEHGYLMERDIQYIMMSTTEKWKYTYNEKGLIQSIRSYENGSEEPTEEVLYTYDNLGNLLEKQHHKNGQYLSEIEFIFNDKTHLLTYILNRDVATNLIQVISFKEYQFFP